MKATTACLKQHFARLKYRRKYRPKILMQQPFKWHRLLRISDGLAAIHQSISTMFVFKSIIYGPKENKAPFF